MQWTLKSYLLKIISQRKGMNILLSAVGKLFHSHFISAEVTREYFAFLSFFLDKKQEYFSCFTVLGRERQREPKKQYLHAQKSVGGACNTNLSLSHHPSGIRQY